jgi:hypothetical protein
MRYLGLYSNKGCLGGSIRKFQKASGRGLELRQIFEGLHIQCDSQEMDTFAVIARRIWLRRNLVVHENSFIHPNRLVQEAVVALDEFWKANDADERPARQKGEITRNPWQQPPVNMIKINWDARSCGKEDWKDRAGDNCERLLRSGGYGEEHY